MKNIIFFQLFQIINFICCLGNKNQILSDSELENKKSTYFEINLPNNSYDDNQDSISICKMSIENLSPSSNSNYMSKVENENPGMDRS